MAHPSTIRPGGATALPPWGSVLVVVAHPDDESFGLGAVIDRFVGAGATVTVLCFTQGEASTLHGVEGDLRDVRAHELRAAADVLGIGRVELLGFPDGALADSPVEVLAGHVSRLATEVGADGLLVFDAAGVTGHPDHVRATEAAVAAAGQLHLGVLGWTLPQDVSTRLADEFGVAFTGHPAEQIDVVLEVSRSHQRAAVGCHPSQAVPGSVLWRRLVLLDDREHLRWLRVPPARADRSA